MQRYTFVPKFFVPTIWVRDLYIFIYLTKNIFIMQHYRLATNHPEFSEFLEKEMKQLKITKDQLREACHISPTHFNNIKKGSIIMK